MVEHKYDPIEFQNKIDKRISLEIKPIDEKRIADLEKRINIIENISINK